MRSPAGILAAVVLLFALAAAGAWWFLAEEDGVEGVDGPERVTADATRDADGPTIEVAGAEGRLGADSARSAVLDPAEGIADERGAGVASLADPLVVRCVDARSGEPVGGIDVLIVAHRAVAQTTRTWEVEVLRATGDALTGVAAFDRDDVVDALTAPGVVAAVVRAEVVASERFEITLGVAALPTEPLDIRLPPLGRVVLEIAAPGGDPLPGAPVGRLELAASPDVLASRRFQDGTAVFAQVALHEQLVGWAAARDDRVPMATAPAFDGPRGAGEEVRVALTCTKDVATLRLVDEDGAPLRDARIALLADGRNGERELRTDAEGRVAFQLFRLRTAAGASYRATDLGLRLIERAGSTQPPREARVSASLPEGRVDPPRVHDLGVARVRTPPELVRGVVVTERGDPLSGVAVGLVAPESGDRRRTVATVESDRAGRFAVAWTPKLGRLLEAGELRLVVDGAETAADGKAFDTRRPIGFALGEDLRVVVAARGTISGRVEWTAEGERPPLGVRSMRIDDDGQVVHGASTRVRDDGTFSLFAPRETWELALHVDDSSGHGPTISHLAGVVVSSGAVSDDHRLDPWRAGARRSHVTVLGVGGEPLRSGRASFATDSRLAGIVEFDRNGLDVWIGEERIDAWFASHDSELEGAGTLVRDLRDGAVVTLRPCVDVSITIRTDPDGTRSLDELDVDRPIFEIAPCMPLPGAEPVRGVYTGRVRPLPHVVQLDDFLFDGPVDVHLWVAPEGSRDGVELGPPRTIVIDPDEPVQRFAIEITDADIEAAARALREAGER